jgi:hypothetical protein
MKISVFFVIILVAVNACAMGWNYVSGASPNYSNLTNKPIYNIKVKSGNINLHSTSFLSGGNELSASNFIKNKNDMYGDVVVSWKNAADKEFTRTFKFTKEDDKNAYIIKKLSNGETKQFNVGSSLVFEFTQDNVEYYTSAIPDFWERGKKAAKIMSKIRREIDKEKEANMTDKERAQRRKMEEERLAGRKLLDEAIEDAFKKRDAGK